jgi:hypothetical protein
MSTTENATKTLAFAVVHDPEQPHQPWTVVDSRGEKVAAYPHMSQAVADAAALNADAEFERLYGDTVTKLDTLNSFVASDVELLRRVAGLLGVTNP